MSFTKEAQTVKELGKVQVKLLIFSRVCSLCCSFERKVMLQLITDNEVNMMGTETMMWSNAKKWLTAEKISCEPKQFLLTSNFIHPTNNISSQFYQWNAIPPRSFCQRQETASNHFVHTNKSIVDYYFLEFGRTKTFSSLQYMKWKILIHNCIMYSMNMNLNLWNETNFLPSSCVPPSKDSEERAFNSSKMWEPEDTAAPRKSSPIHN